MFPVSLSQSTSKKYCPNKEVSSGLFCPRDRKPEGISQKDLHDHQDKHGDKAKEGRV
jgi:hypothetical protein